MFADEVSAQLLSDGAGVARDRGLLDRRERDRTGSLVLCYMTLDKPLTSWGLSWDVTTGPGGLLEEEQVVNSLESEGRGQRGGSCSLELCFLSL